MPMRVWRTYGPSVDVWSAGVILYVTSHKLQATSYKLQVTSYKLQATSYKLQVLALYGGPYLVVNSWLIIYTWLQHTDVDVPHLSADAHTYMRGAFLSIDRPYPPLIDWLHHRIGTTHVAHHIDCTIPHYHAREATDAVAKAFPAVADGGVGIR